MLSLAAQCSSPHAECSPLLQLLAQKVHVCRHAEQQREPPWFPDELELVQGDRSTTFPEILARARANRVCTHCGSVAVADELHMIFECPALQAVRQRYAPLFSTDTNTMRSFFAQQDHMQVFKFVLDCLDVFHI